ncbi:MAG: hypothetical protein KDK33_07430 [Leptospiraceae bacterium]|nr:hypothetical protein [Leptospiraceae bacterium]
MESYYDLVEHTEDVTPEYKTETGEWFLDTYPTQRAVDLYHWLYLGEFGYGGEAPSSALDQLTEDIRIARFNPPRFSGVWEPLGLAGRLLKINLVAYSDAGCPLPRLIHLSERVRELRPNSLRFKGDWNFMKTIVVPGMEITLEQIHQFENQIPFHMTPYMGFTEEFERSYGQAFRIVPRKSFFQYFPEFEDDTFSRY